MLKIFERSVPMLIVATLSLSPNIYAAEQENDEATRLIAETLTAIDTRHDKQIDAALSSFLTASVGTRKHAIVELLMMQQELADLANSDEDRLRQIQWLLLQIESSIPQSELIAFALSLSAESPSVLVQREME